MIQQPPKSIISLVPSLTELLFDLGLEGKIIGRTRFCIHPEEKVREVDIVGGTKNPRINKIRDANPGLILSNREENRKEDIKLLQEEFRVHLTDINSIEDALLSIHEIGEICGVPDKAQELISAIRTEYDSVPDEPVLSAAYLIWREPWMSVGRNTYIHSVLTHWGFENVFGNITRYPKTTLKQISEKNPDVILLSSEPYPFRDKHAEEIASVCNESRILQVDGEWFSWYGSRMLPSFKKLNTFRKAIS